MTRLAVALVLLLGLAAIALANPPFPCTYSNPNGMNYNLSPMYRDPTLSMPDFQYKAADMSTYYVYDMCFTKACPAVTCLDALLATMMMM